MTNNIDLKDSGIKLGIIGTNFISDTLVQAAKMTGLCVSAVFSRRFDTGEAFAKKHGIENVFCDFEEFLKSDIINAVYVASPNFCHCPQTIAALDHGKHVLCEKPAASNLADFEKMRSLAKEKGLVLLEAMRPAFDPALDIVRQQMKKCGKLRYAHFEYSQYSSRYDKFKNGEILNAFNPDFSNAAVMDIGVYPLNVCVSLFGAPDAVISRSVILENGFEGQGNVILSYGDMTAEVTYSKITHAVLPSIIRGEDGEVHFGNALSKIDKMSFFSRKNGEEKIDFCAVENNMIYELSAFCDFVNKKRDNEEYLDCTAKTLAVIDEIRRQNGIVFPDDK